MFRISSTSVVPVYEQIKEHLRYRIALGQYAAGDKVPSKRTLAKELGVNVHTVGKVYRQLEEEGMVTARRGSGVYVNDQLPVTPKPERRETLSEIAASSLRQVIGSGMEVEDFIAELREQMKDLKSALSPRKAAIIFVECNEEQCRDYADELNSRLQIETQPVLLHDLCAIQEADLVITTLFHIHEVRRALKHKARWVVSVVVRPKREVLDRIHTLRVPELGFVCRDARSLPALTREVRTLVGVHCPITSCTVGDAAKLARLIETVKALVYMPPCRSAVRGMAKGRNIALIEWSYCIHEASIERIRDLIKREELSRSTI